MSPITSCGRLIFPVRLFLFILPLRSALQLYAQWISICLHDQEELTFVFIRLDMWIKLCKTIKKKKVIFAICNKRHDSHQMHRHKRQVRQKHRMYTLGCRVS